MKIFLLVAAVLLTVLLVLSLLDIISLSFKKGKNLHDAKGKMVRKR